MATPGQWSRGVQQTVAFLAGIAAIVAVFFGFQYTSQSATISNNNDTIINVEQTNSSLQAAYNAISSSNAALIQQNSSLQSQLSVPPPVAQTPTTSLSTDGSPAVRHQGLLVLTPNPTGTADLDAPSTDPDWARTKATGDGESDGPLMDTTNLYVVHSAQMVFLGSDPADYSVCSQAQTYASTDVAIGKLDKGSNLCIRTSAGRYAMLTLSKDASAEQIDLDVTVWEKS